MGDCSGDEVECRSAWWRELGLGDSSSVEELIFKFRSYGMLLGR